MPCWARENFQPALQWLDLLIHREILRLRANYQLSLDEFRGLYISDHQVDTLVQRVSQNTGAEININDMTAKAEAIRPSALQSLADDTLWQSASDCYHLSTAEQALLLMAFAPELHEKYEALYAYLNNDITRKYPTVELALRLLTGYVADEYRNLLSAENKLFKQGLLQAFGTNPNPYTLKSGFRLSPTLCSYLLGCKAFDRSLGGVATLDKTTYRDWQEFPLNQQTLDRLDAITVAIKTSRRALVIVVEGNKNSGRCALAGNMLAGAEFGVLTLDLVALAEDKENRASHIWQLKQSALLSKAGVIINGLDLLAGDENKHNHRIQGLVADLLDCGYPLIFPVSNGVPWQRWLNKNELLIVQLLPPTAAEREKIWSFWLQAAGLTPNVPDMRAVADFFQLDFSQIQTAVDGIRFQHSLISDEHGRTTRSALFQAAKQQSFGEIGKLAHKVEDTFSMDELILPPATRTRINEVIAAIRNRRTVFDIWDMQRRVGSAKGLMVLFAGASGTGKTMTASVIANEMGLDLYRIELSGIVSKYIGETEKNLDKIFTAAKQANCLLFFDEADALFGKRSEVKDAHDRYANIEVAYLLQKMENHDGIVILTTNLAKSIDPAFSRRMQFIIEFPRPDVPHRESLWRGMFGDRAPLADDVDFNFLARQFENTGGDIKNIALDAAMLAASTEEQLIDMALLVRASARQMVKQGKVPSANEFKHYFHLVNVNAQ